MQRPLHAQRRPRGFYLFKPPCPCRLMSPYATNASFSAFSHLSQNAHTATHRKFKRTYPCTNTTHQAMAFVDEIIELWTKMLDADIRHDQTVFRHKTIQQTITRAYHINTLPFCAKKGILDQKKGILDFCIVDFCYIVNPAH